MKNVMKKLNKKGFTLAELLIVVAIIAVLVAISIPIFNSQLEKSRDAVSIANIRTAYAEASTTALTGSSSGNATYTPDATGSGCTVVVKDVNLKGTQEGFSGLQSELPFTNSLSDTSTEGGTAGTYELTFKYADATGDCTLTDLTKK